MNLNRPDWKRRPITTAAACAASLIRKQFLKWSKPVVRYHMADANIIADLNTNLGMELYRYRYYDRDIELVTRLLRPGDTFVDGGANIGLFTLAAAKKVGESGRVISFEPAPATFDALSKNVGINNFKWVDTRQQALADHAGELEMTVFPAQHAGLSSFASPAGIPAGRKHIVQVVTLDSAIGQNEQPSLVKLDLEGAELLALRGSMQLIARSKPHFLIEVDPENLKRMNARPAEILQLLVGCGYTLFSANWEPNRGVVLHRFNDQDVTEYFNLFATVDPNEVLLRVSKAI